MSVDINITTSEDTEFFSYNFGSFIIKFTSFFTFLIH